MQQGSADRIAQHVAADLRRTTIKRAKLRHPVRIRRRPNVKHEIRFKRDSVLVSEACLDEYDTMIQYYCFACYKESAKFVVEEKDRKDGK